MNDRQNFEEILKDCALWGGIIVALISIYFSYDGLDQTVTGVALNPDAGWMTVVIGLVMAVVITLLQFIFNSDFSRLSTTLKIIGILSYIYSIWTNKLGIAHIFGFSEVASWFVAIAFDVVPEALIAWAWDDDTNGDLIGNVFKGFSSLRRGSKRKSNKLEQKREPVFRIETDKPLTYPPVQWPKKGKGRGYYEQQKKEREVPNRFSGE
jgi:hypothetical protein